MTSDQEKKTPEPRNARPVLRPYQARTIQALRTVIRGGKRRILVVAPTGAGKTVIFTAGILAPALARGNRGLVLVHRKELLDQAVEKLQRAGVGQVSVIRADDERYDPECPVQVATIETLIARDLWPAAEVVIVDECHHYAGGTTWAQFEEHYRTSVVIGFSATPERADGSALGDLFESLVAAARYSELIAAGHLVPCEVYCPSERLSGRIAANPANAFHTYAAGRPGIVFCPTVEAAHQTSDELSILGYRSAAVTGQATRERDFAVARFRAGELDVLTTVQVLTEGFDAPRAKVAVLARTCGHVSTYLQIVGRVLRPDGTGPATLVDLTGATLEHGLPTADREYSLEGQAIRPTATLPSLWQCKACGWISQQAPANRQCPNCQAVLPVRPGLKLSPRALARVVAWTCPGCGREHFHMPLSCQQCGAETPRLERASAESDAARVEYLARQIALCRSRGWNVYAARHRYRGKYGVQPTHTEWAAALEMAA